MKILKLKEWVATQAARQFTGNEWRAVSLTANRILMHADNVINALAETKNNDGTVNIVTGMPQIKLLHCVLPGILSRVPASRHP